MCSKVLLISPNRCASPELARQPEIEHLHFLICGGPGETLATLETCFQNSWRLAGAIIVGPLRSCFAMLQRLMPQGAAVFTRAVPAA